MMGSGKVFQNYFASTTQAQKGFQEKVNYFATEKGHDPLWGHFGGGQPVGSTGMERRTVENFRVSNSSRMWLMMP